MGIITVNENNPKIKLPLYVKVYGLKHNDVSEGETYDVRVNNTEYVHECFVATINTKPMGDVSDYVWALAGSEGKKSKAVDRAVPFDYKPNREVNVVYLIRLDKLKEFVTGDTEVDFDNHNLSDITMKEI